MFRRLIKSVASMDFMLWCAFFSGFFAAFGVMHIVYTQDWPTIIAALVSFVFYGFLATLQRREIRTAVNHAIKEDREKKSEQC